jgi:hypothetical protein
MAISPSAAHNSDHRRPFRGILTTPRAGGQRLSIRPCSLVHEVKHDGYRLIVRRESYVGTFSGPRLF